jgi:hypothetical protein
LWNRTDWDAGNLFAGKGDHPAYLSRIIRAPMLTHIPFGDPTPEQEKLPAEPPLKPAPLEATDGIEKQTQEVFLRKPAKNVSN